MSLQLVNTYIKSVKEACYSSLKAAMICTQIVTAVRWMNQNPVDVHKIRSSYGSSQTTQQFINCCAFYEFTKYAVQFINCANSQIASNNLISRIAPTLSMSIVLYDSVSNKY